MRKFKIIFLAISLITALLLVSEGMAVVEIKIDARMYQPSRLTPGATVETKGFDPVVEAYQKIQPDVKITFVIGPAYSALREWQVAQLTAGTAPDIIWTQPDWANEDFKRGWLVAFDPYLEKPNPYVPGNKKWIDIFYPAINVWRAADKKLYMLLGDQVQVGVYYNKDILRKTGIGPEAMPPRNWKQLVDFAKKIRGGGVVPFATAGNNLDQMTWISGWLTNFYYYPLLKDYDSNGDGWISKIEIAEATKKGTFSFLQERNKERLKTLREYFELSQRGAEGVDWDVVNSFWVKGQAAFLITGTWMMQTFKKDPARTFDFGTFYFPVLDSQTSPLIPDGVPPTNKAAGYGSFQYSVTSSAVKAGKVDLAIDFLMFASAPQNISPMVAEAGFALAGVKGSRHHPDLEPLAESVSYTDAPFQEDDSLYDYQFGQEFLAVMTLYLPGRINLEEAAKRLQYHALEASDRVLTEYR